MDLIVQSKEPDCACAIGANVFDNICVTRGIITNIKEKFKIQTEDIVSVMDEVKVKTKCDDNSCVVKKLVDDNIITKQLLVQSLAPSGPRHTLELLSNFNIQDIMTQLNKEYPTFCNKIPWSLIDFNTEPKMPLGKIDIVDISKKYETFATVLNTDNRNGGGIHWFSVFFDFRKKPYTIEYFNSSGNKPRVEVQDFMLECNKQLHPNAKIINGSNIHHQKKNTECGVYSVYYIIRRAEGVPIESFNTIIPDGKMTQFRKRIFNSEKNIEKYINTIFSPQ